MFRFGYGWVGWLAINKLHRHHGMAVLLCSEHGAMKLALAHVRLVKVQGS